MKADTPPRRRGLVLPSLCTLAAFAILIALGVWQLQRLHWKEDLIATLDRRLGAPPVPLPPRVQWPALTAAADEFQRVALHATLAPASEARVYASGSALRDDIKGAGYFAFAPARLADGSTVVINRGFVGNPNPDASLKPIGVSDGGIDLVGVLRWPEQPGLFITPYSERQDLWLVRDPRAMAERYGWGTVAPFYVEQESPPPPGGVPRPGRLTVKLRNDHFGYALTWFGLAAALLATFGFWIARRDRA